MTYRLEDALLPGLPVAHIQERMDKAPGDEIGSGKFHHPESSAALVVNAFGPFLTSGASPTALPLLPIDPVPECMASQWPEAEVEIEVECAFPWKGGTHAWLDVRIDLPGALIGIESKRYEPFRDTSKAAFSDKYDLDVWGDAMTRHGEMRDRLRAEPHMFRHLNAAQLVKHAYGLRTQAHENVNPMDGRPRTPMLLYLYAEPATWPDGSAVDDATKGLHRGEIESFADAAAGDEVGFAALSYRSLLDSWKASGNEAAAEHACAIEERFKPSA